MCTSLIFPAPRPTLTIVDGPGVVLGSRVRIKQPRFPRSVWAVTQVEAPTSRTWVSRSPGLLLDLVATGAEIETSAALARFVGLLRHDGGT